MDKTEQFNLRISKTILADLEFIERFTEVSKSDWVRIYIAESVQKAKDELLHKVQCQFVVGRIDEAEFKRLVGCTPAESLNKRREAYDKKMLEFTKSEAFKDFAKKALLDPPQR